MSNDRFTLRCAVYLFMIKSNKILLLKRINTGWKDGEYGVPAGHLEKNETVLQAAVREAREETTMEIDEKDLKFIHIMHRKGGKGERKGQGRRRGIASPAPVPAG